MLQMIYIFINKVVLVKSTIRYFAKLIVFYYILKIYSAVFNNIVKEFEKSVNSG